jgi:hypothetical protein
MHWSGQMRCRVTTLTRYWTDGSNSADLINGFDQVRCSTARCTMWMQLLA